MPREKGGALFEKNGSWCGRWRKKVIDPTTLQRIDKQEFRVLGSVAKLSEKSARLRLRDEITKDAGLTHDGDITVRSFIESVWIPLRESRWRPSTRSTALHRLGIVYQHFDGIGLRSVTPVMLQGYVDGMAKDWCAAIVKNTVADLRSIFKLAVDDDYLLKSPARYLRIPSQLKVTARPFLSIEDVGALIEESKAFGIVTQETALLTVMFSTGLRAGELLGMKWGDLDFDKRTFLLHGSVYRGKYRNYTKVLDEGQSKLKALPEFVADMLMRRKAETSFDGDNDFVFCNDKGHALHATNLLSRVIKPMAKAAGITTPVNLQCLRRTVATHAQHFGSLKDVAEIMGHSKLQTTFEIYQQTITQTVRDTAENTSDAFLTAAAKAAAKKQIAKA
jgi:integrase